ncbi:MAG: hypothetical protein DMG31_19375 [Acidobacteria bacterium]|nr:MAG: hypothetical protein DMG31_19375 [Acidobacteriota bacterium]
MYLWPWITTEVSVMPSSALPLNRPADFALVTSPETFAPRGITSWLPSTIGSASEASTCNPGAASFELTDWSTVTLIAVPAGTIIGGACSCFGAACSAAGLALFAAAPVLLLG